MVEALGTAQERAAEFLNETWTGEEISKDQVVIHVVMDGGENDPFIYTGASLAINERMDEVKRKRLAEALARTGEQLLEDRP